MLPIGRLWPSLTPYTSMSIPWSLLFFKPNWLGREGWVLRPRMFSGLTFQWLTRAAARASSPASATTRVRLPPMRTGPMLC
ncbi:hypothetical protein D3C85_1671330 [compost metagenome]